MSNSRFRAKREHGSDWCIVDLQNKEAVKATGLDQEEAEITANQWNSAEAKKSENLAEKA